MPFLYEGQTYPDDVVLAIEEVNYRLQDQTPALLADLGVERVAPPQPIDDRYFQNVDGQVEPWPWEVLKSKLQAHAAACRYTLEVGGFDFNGVIIKTDRESQAMIAGAFALVQDDPTKTIKFKTAAGFVDLDAATMSAIARSVGDHVQACFELEASIAAQIEAETIKTFEEVEGASYLAG